MLEVVDEVGQPSKVVAMLVANNPHHTLHSVEIGKVPQLIQPFDLLFQNMIQFTVIKFENHFSVTSSLLDSKTDPNISVKMKNFKFIVESNKRSERFKKTESDQASSRPCSFKRERL